MAEKDETTEEVKPETPPVNYMDGIMGWYDKPLWSKPPAKEPPEEKTQHIGVRLPKEIVAAVDGHAEACGVTRTTYIRNCILTAMFFWAEDGGGLLTFVSGLWSNPAAKVFMQGLLNFAESMSDNVLDEMSRIVTGFDCEVLSRKTGIPGDKIRNAVENSLASLLIQEKAVPQVEPPVRVQVSGMRLSEHLIPPSSVSSDSFVSWSPEQESEWQKEHPFPAWMTLFTDLFGEIESFPFDLGGQTLARMLEMHVGVDLPRVEIVELLDLLSVRPRESIESVLEAIELFPNVERAEKMFCITLWRDNAVETQVCIKIVCGEAAWEASWGYRGADGVIKPS